MEDHQRLPFVRDDSGVATLTLKQGDRPVIVMDWDLLRAIDAVMDEAEKLGSDLKGFVLASAGRVFVAGANLQQIMSLSDSELDEYIAFGQQVCARIAKLPCTSVAAINGAALGGGLEIALHCDVLLGARPATPEPGKDAKPYLVGLPEASLSICPGWGGSNTLPARMDPAQAIRRACEGKPMTIHEAAESGLVEELAPLEELLARARDRALKARCPVRDHPPFVGYEAMRERVRSGLEGVRSELPDTQAARAVTACIEAGLEGGWRAGLDAEREHLVRLRATKEAQDAIKAFFDRGAVKK